MARAEIDLPVAVAVVADDGEVLSDRAERTVRELYAHPLIDTTWSRYEPGERGPDPHVHHLHTDAFFVVEGELRFGVGPGLEPVHAPAGTFVLVPPHVMHTFVNESDAAARWLNFHAPSTGFMAFMRGDPKGFDSYDAPPGGGREAGEAIVSSAATCEPRERDGSPRRMLGGNRQLAVAELEIAAGFETEAHAPAETVESFFVLAGEIEFTLAGQRVRAGRRTWVSAPPGARLGFRNAGRDPARVLHVRAPDPGSGEERLS